MGETCEAYIADGNAEINEKIKDTLVLNTNGNIYAVVFLCISSVISLLSFARSISGFKILVTIPVMPLEDIIPITAPIGMATVHKIKICKITI
ncbi:hypothetical protein ACTPD5_08930, partial [Clostridioides difficile]